MSTFNFANERNYISILVPTEFRPFKMDLMMWDKIEMTTFAPFAVQAIWRTSPFKNQSGDPSDSAIQFHDDFSEDGISRPVMRNLPC